MANLDAITLPAKRIVTLTGSCGGPPHARDLSNSTLTFSRFIGSPSGHVYVSVKGRGSFDPDKIQAALELIKRDK
jgi:hypothetical protein